MSCQIVLVTKIHGILVPQNKKKFDTTLFLSLKRFSILIILRCNIFTSEVSVSGMDHCHGIRRKGELHSGGIEAGYALHLCDPGQELPRNRRAQSPVRCHPHRRLVLFWCLGIFQVFHSFEYFHLVVKWCQILDFNTIAI